MNEKGGPKPASQCPAKVTTTQSIWPATWRRVLARRRAQRELDRLLGRPTRPDIAETYGTRSS